MVCLIGAGRRLHAVHAQSLHSTRHDRDHASRYGHGGTSDRLDREPSAPRHQAAAEV